MSLNAAALKKLGLVCAIAAAGLGGTALALPSAGAAGPATLYVDGSSVGGVCSDARTAEQVTVSTPWCTIGKGLKSAPDGSTVAVRRGTYPQVFVADVKHSAYVKLTPYPGETPRIEGLDADRMDHVRFEGLTFFNVGIGVRTGNDLQFVGNDLQLKPAGARTASGITLAKVRTVLIEGNRMANGRDGVNLQGTVPASTDITIWGNHFERLGNDPVHITTGQSRILVAANFFENCMMRREIDPDAHADAIQALGPTQDVIVWGNYVTGGRGFLFMVSPGDQTKKGFGHKGLLIQNNFFVGRDFAIRTFSTPGAQIVNNTIWGTSTSEASGLDIGDRMGSTNDRSAKLIVVNNIAKRLRINAGVTFADRDHNIIQKGPKGGPNDRIATPDFAGAGDYRLDEDSIGIDDADRAYAPSVDIEGRSRLNGPDIGAFETGGVVQPGLYLKIPPPVAAILRTSGAAADVRAELGG